VANFECLAATVMNQNVVQVELLVTLDSTDARFHSVLKLTFPSSIKKKQDNKLFVFFIGTTLDRVLLVWDRIHWLDLPFEEQGLYIS